MHFTTDNSKELIRNFIAMDHRKLYETAEDNLIFPEEITEKKCHKGFSLPHMTLHPNNIVCYSLKLVCKLHIQLCQEFGRTTG